MTPAWYAVRNAADLPTPALLLHEERIGANLDAMLRIAGDPARLRPHVKTHKLPQLVARQVARGITRFKAATIAEADMTAGAGGIDILLAYQPVGPLIAGFLELSRRHPHTRFSCLVDNPESVDALARAATAAGTRVEVLVDLDIGQHRTGIAPGQPAGELYRQVASRPSLVAGGLHAYDGHLHQSDPTERAAAADAAFAPVGILAERLRADGLSVPRIIAGGSPTFPFHARRADVELSPGTTVLWDAGYASRMPDLPFLPAAVLLTRVVSRPRPGRLCLDLGHKAVAAEMPWPRVVFLNLPDTTLVGQNEEHLVVETPHADAFPVGADVYALPWHVCPTVARHDEVWPVRDGAAGAPWPVCARGRRLPKG